MHFDRVSKECPHLTYLVLCTLFHISFGQTGHLPVDPPSASFSGYPPPLPFQSEQLDHLYSLVTITEVSAMCTTDGITAQVMFDHAFSGKIYSYRYASVHDCIYFNTADMNMILFSIPNDKCGTRVTKDNNNNLKSVENEVYVQFDKDFQNAEDRRYLFVCDMQTQGSGVGGGGGVESKTGFPPSSSISSPPPFSTSSSGSGSSNTFTVQSGQGVTVLFTPTPTLLSGIGSSATGSERGTSSARRNVYMEIQDGLGPNKPIVQRTLQLGDTITLVVRAPIPDQSSNFDIFVHNCFANDGTDQNQIEFIDADGCTSRQQIAGAMLRSRTASDIIYYVPMKAFKFPTSENVYFSCSVDVCTTSACVIKEICAGRSQSSSTESVPRKRIRAAASKHETNFLKSYSSNFGIRQHEVFNVSNNVRIADKLLQYAAKMLQTSNMSNDGQRRSTFSTASVKPEHVSIWKNSLVFGLIISAAVSVLLTIAVAVVLIFLKRQKHCRPKTETESSSHTSSTIYS